MKKLLTLLLLFYFSLAYSQTGKYVPELAKFDTAMLNLLKQYKVPGGQLAITYQGRLVYSRGFGYADTVAKAPVEPNSIFRLASVSKPITGIAIMRLVEQGKLKLNDTVFGTKGILNDAAYETIKDTRVLKITLRHLLTHSAGWDRDVSGDPMFNAFTIAMAMSATPPAGASTVISYVLSQQNLDFAPGAKYAYSNLGYCIIGRVIEKVTGKTYESYVRDSILIPLGISTMRIGYNLKKDKLPMEVDYYSYPGAGDAFSVYDNTTKVPWPYGGFNIEAMDAHGAWVASAQDMCRLLVAVDGFATKPDILKKATIDTMVFPSKTNANYALGWSVNSSKNWWHMGSLTGTSSEIVRGNNQLNWAILFNTRTANSNLLNNAMDALVWNVLPSIKSWPASDQFAGIRTIENPGPLKIYPNPSPGIFTVEYPGGISSIEVYSSLGKKVYNSQGGFGGEIDLSMHSKGLYFIRLTDKEKTLTSKLVIK